MKTILVLALGLVACGGSEPGTTAGPHDAFDGVWQVTSAVGKPAQQFNIYRDSVGTLQLSGWVFYPTDPDHISYVGCDNLSASDSTATGTALMDFNTNTFTVPLAIVFDSGSRFTGTLGAVHLEGSR